MLFLKDIVASGRWCGKLGGLFFLYPRIKPKIRRGL